MTDLRFGRNFKWDDLRGKRRADFAKLLDAPTFQGVFNDKFIEGLERRRDQLSTRSYRVQAIQLGILLVLGVTLLSVHSTISFFGLSATDGRDLREVLLVVASSVQLINVFSSAEQFYIRDLLETYVAKISKGNEIAIGPLRARYGLGPNLFILPKFGDERPRLCHTVIIVFAGLGLVCWLLMTLIVTALVQIATIVDIIRDPSISRTVSVFVVIYVLVVDAAVMGIQAITGGFSVVGLTPAPTEPK